MTDLDALLVERKKTHGEFSDHAEATQRMKEILHAYEGWLRMTVVEREAAEMIVHKLGRAVTGNPHFADHWQDIAGYALLVVQRTGVEP